MRSSTLLATLLLATPLLGQVTSSRLLNTAKEPQNWLTYNGSYNSQRYSLLTQINQSNVKGLTLKWVNHPKSLEKMEVTPLVVDGVVYSVQGNEVVAIDAESGRVYWTFRYEIPPESNAYVLVVKGLAISGNTLFWATYDAHLIAIDIKNGHALWNKVVADWHDGYQLNMAPLIIKDMVVLGTADNERGVNCWIAAYDAKTGEERWRLYTAPNKKTDPGGDTWGGDSYKYGASPLWVTGSYDPETNLTFWGTGDPNPGWNGDSRPGDNLFSNCVLAVDADTGKMKWFYQFSPHDERDYDSVQVPVLADITWQGKPRKVMLWANRNGVFYVLDRVTGEFLRAKEFVKQNWEIGFDAKGRPIPAPGTQPKPIGLSWIEPATQGGTNWYPPSYSPRTGLMYVSTWANYVGYSPKSAELEKWEKNKRYQGTAISSEDRAKVLRRIPPAYRKEDEGYGAIRALDPLTGDRRWEFKMTNYTESGVLSTASDLVFAGGQDGNFFALNAKTGERLWMVNLGGNVAGGPVTYSVNGKQYVAIAAEGALYSFSLAD